LSIGLLASCSEEDSSSDTATVVSVSQEDLAGQWDMVGFETQNGSTTTTTDTGESFTVDFTQEGSDFDYITIFSTSPNVVTGAGSYSVATTTSITIGGQTFEDMTTSQVGTDDFDPSLYLIQLLLMELQFKFQEQQLSL